MLEHWEDRAEPNQTHGKVRGERRNTTFEGDSAFKGRKKKRREKMICLDRVKPKPGPPSLFVAARESDGQMLPSFQLSKMLDFYE